MSKLLLHVGTHKTATTSIQRYFAHNRDALSDRGMFYPDYDLIGRKSHYAHLGIVNAYSGRHAVFSRTDAKNFFAAVRERVPDYDVTLLSAEPFYRHIAPSNGGINSLSNAEYWEARKAYIEGLAEIFGSDSEIVLVFRPQSDFAESMYQEHVKATQFRWGFRKFLSVFWYHFQYLEQARAWKECFPTTTVLSFDYLKQGGDVVSEFVRVLGLPAQDLPQGEAFNKGLPVDVAVLKRFLNTLGEDQSNIRKKVQKLADSLSENLLAFEKKRSFFDSNEDALEFQSSFDVDNEALRDFFSHETQKTVPVLSPRDRSSCVFGDRLSPEFLVHLLEKAV